MLLEMIKELVYVIKSHQRVDRFYDKTYSKIILEYGFNLKNVFVFVSLKEDVDLYTKKYPLINILKAPKGVAAVDNFITNYFQEGQNIIYMNDDVSGIVELQNNKLKPIKKERLLSIIDAMFGRMKKNKITYGGFYPVPNTLFMSGKKMTYDLCLIMDPFSLVINNKKVRITISDKSDFEKSIQHFYFQNALLRYNHISLKVEYYGTKGGFQGRTAETERNSAKLLQAKYPDYVGSIKYKKDGKTSLRLKSIKSKPINI
tara:strand:- start:847 stop:1623 length:777 start_codon:yes stop_codon:yes gene_type:complete